MVKPPFVDKNGVKKGAWSEEEDSKLSSYILKYGHWNWRLLPKYAGLARCGKSCRLRWVNYLKPGVKRGNYTKEEGDLIEKLHDELENKWSIIAAKLPGRTDNDVKNYWHTHIKKPNKQNTPTSSKEKKKHPINDEAYLNQFENSNQKEKSGVISHPKKPPIHDSMENRNSEELSVSHMYILESSSPSANLNSDMDSSIQLEIIDGSDQLLQSESFCSSSAMESRVDDFSASISGIEDSFWTEPFLLESSYNHIHQFLRRNNYFSFTLFGFLMIL